jgi:hypothetical protein
MLFDKLFAYLEEAGATKIQEKKGEIEKLVLTAKEENTNIQDLSIQLVGVCFPNYYTNSRDAFHWAEHGNIDIQIAEMLGRCGYPVPWTEEEYSYY